MCVGAHPRSLPACKLSARALCAAARVLQVRPSAAIRLWLLCCR